MKGENDTKETISTSILDDRKLRSSSLKKYRLKNGKEIKDGADCFCPYFRRQRELLEANQLPVTFFVCEIKVGDPQQARRLLRRLSAQLNH